MAKADQEKRGSVLVTGANGGIGLGVVRRLAETGWNVFAGVRSEASASAIDALRHKSITPVFLDVTDDASVATMRRQIVAASPAGLAALVNCAGIIVDGPLELIPLDHFRLQFEVNVVGPFAVTRALIPSLRRKAGRVINIGAVSARTTAPFFGPIAASKAALASLTDAMRMELAPFGIKVGLIEPGGIETGIWNTSAAFQTEGLKSQPSELVKVYKPAMDAMRAAFAKAGMDQPKVVVDAVVDGLTRSGGPKPRILVGKGASQLAFLSHLPINLRDSLLMSSLGISKALRPAAEQLVRSEATPLQQR